LEKLKKLKTFRFEEKVISLCHLAVSLSHSDFQNIVADPVEDIIALDGDYHLVVLIQRLQLKVDLEHLVLVSGLSDFVPRSSFKSRYLDS
jgi:hypothetical protein